MRVELPRRSQWLATLLIAVAFCVVFVYGPRASAQTPAFTTPQTKLVIFADHRMADGEWTALVAALRRDLTGSADGPALVSDAVLVHGDAAAMSDPLLDGIAVYLHGNCAVQTPASYEKRTVIGALGWVPDVNGRIQPYVNVDCTLLAQMLEWSSMHMSERRRDIMMGEAIARVITHEWLHYARQSAAHTDHGISKSGFSVADLLADESEFKPRKHVRHQSKSEGM